MLNKRMLSMGCDPELFFRSNGRIIGSERIIPEDGLGNNLWSNRVVRDGIQLELNPVNATSVRFLGTNLGSCFELLQRRLIGRNVDISFDGVVEVEREELDALSEKSRVLGCAPSRNIYGLKPISVDARKYMKRSAGGHLHIGLDYTSIYDKRSVDERNRLIPLLDIFVGNTCVLLDRDPNAAERRQNYGRAGEYRLPKHGVEYRTLSNFWLRNYTIFSMIWGMVELAVGILQETLVTSNDLESELVRIVDIDRVIDAINLNRSDLAWQNWYDIKPFILRYVPHNVGFQVNPRNIEKFEQFIRQTQSVGLENAFPADPVKHWIGKVFFEFSDYLEQFK
ncbi:MAG TPA: hypothetical protein VM577_08890 [Anaerovoracaceae bacterium]|nr:hypothetical protein [Anaerovoracaceae bacterium]